MITVRTLYIIITRECWEEAGSDGGSENIGSEETGGIDGLGTLSMFSASDSESLFLKRPANQARGV